MYVVYSSCARKFYELCVTFDDTTMQNQQENDKEMMSSLLAFRAKLDLVVSSACDGNESYQYKLKEAWETFLNAR